MPEKTIEIYILEDGSFVLFQTFIELKEIMEEVGQFQLLFLVSNCPIEGSRLKDYLPGLHHRDELFRCKTLLFMYKHYGGEALPLIIQNLRYHLP